MSGYLDNLNFDSDEDFEETAAGRAGARPADSQHEAAGDGGRGRGIGGAVAVVLFFLELRQILTSRFIFWRKKPE